MEVTMKKVVVLFLFYFCFILAGYDVIFAQDNSNVPFLLESDIVAIESVLPEDTFFESQESPTVDTEDKPGNEMPRLNTSLPIYHLLVLDRAHSPNSDISDVGSMRVLYTYRHGRDGYLIALYVSSVDGPVFPQLPARSRIVLNLSTTRPDTIREYINSSAFRRFVTARAILTRLQEALREAKRL
jgi:hypothetical protein